MVQIKRVKNKTNNPLIKDSVILWESRYLLLLDYLILTYFKVYTLEQAYNFQDGGV